MNYYFADPAYMVTARLDRYEKPEPIIVATSKGNRQAYPEAWNLHIPASRR